MSLEVLLVSIAALFLAGLLTGVVRRVALAHGVLDIPNERSSHTTVTPRGGGLAIVLTVTAAWIVLGLRGILPANLVWALTGGGLAVAAVGFVDDRRPVRPVIRLAVHFAAACWAVGWVGGVAALDLGGHVVSLGWGGQLLAVLLIVWVLNLFNFMDGIDGIAICEGLFVALAAALLSATGGGPPYMTGAAVAFAGGSGGFLWWNWPPAKIFMGDVGSGYMGYVLGLLAIAATSVTPAALWVWLILGGVFFVDATATLVRRSLRGERVHQAHRSHAYQWSARRWQSHKRVTLAVVVLNLLWLLPFALLATLYPQHSMWIACGALVPLVVLALRLGSGRKELMVS